MMTRNTDFAAPLRRSRFALDLLTTVVLLVAALVVIWANWPTPPPPPNGIVLPHDAISLEGPAALGSANAPVVLVVYSDFQCPYCGRFARDTVPRIRQEYVDSGKLQLVFRNLPLPIHALARASAVAGVCASRQGRFWELHDLVFQDQQNLEPADFVRRAADLDMDISAYHDCLDDASALREIEADEASAQQMRVRSTPTSVIGIRQRDGRVRLVQALSGDARFESVAPILDAAVRRSQLERLVPKALTGVITGAVGLVGVATWRRRRRPRSS